MVGAYNAVDAALYICGYSDSDVNSLDLAVRNNLSSSSSRNFNELVSLLTQITGPGGSLPFWLDSRYPTQIWTDMQGEGTTCKLYFVDAPKSTVIAAKQDAQTIMDGGTLGGSGSGGSGSAPSEYDYALNHFYKSAYIDKYISANGTEYYNGGSHEHILPNNIYVNLDSHTESLVNQYTSDGYDFIIRLTTNGNVGFSISTGDRFIIFAKPSAYTTNYDSNGDFSTIEYSNTETMYYISYNVTNVNVSGDNIILSISTSGTPTSRRANKTDTQNFGYVYPFSGGTNGSLPVSGGGSGSGSGSGGGSSEPGIDLPDPYTVVIPIDNPYADIDVNVTVDNSLVEQLLRQILADMRNLDRSTGDLVNLQPVIDAINNRAVDLSGVISAINNIEMPEQTDMSDTNALLSDILDDMANLDRSTSDLVDLSGVVSGLSSVVSAVQSFAIQSHTDFGGVTTAVSTVATAVGNLETQIRTDLSTLNGSIGTLDAHMRTDLASVVSAVNSFATQSHTDFGAVSTAMGDLDSHIRTDLASVVSAVGTFASQSHTDLLTLQQAAQHMSENLDSLVNYMTGQNSWGEIRTVLTQRMQLRSTSGGSETLVLCFDDAMYDRMCSIVDSLDSVRSMAILVDENNVGTLYCMSFDSEAQFNGNSLSRFYHTDDYVHCEHYRLNCTLSNGVLTVNSISRVNYTNQGYVTASSSRYFWHQGGLGFSQSGGYGYGLRNWQNDVLTMLSGVGSVDLSEVTGYLDLIEQDMFLAWADSSNLTITSTSGVIPRILKETQQIYTEVHSYFSEMLEYWDGIDDSFVTFFTSWADYVSDIDGKWSNLMNKLDQIYRRLGKKPWTGDVVGDPGVTLPDPGTDIVPIGDDDIGFPLPHFDWDELAPILKIPALKAALLELMAKFPFCMLNEIVTIGGYMLRQPMTPVFDLPAPNPSDWSHPYMVHIDLSDFDQCAAVLRTLIMMWAGVRISNKTIRMWMGDKEVY